MGNVFDCATEGVTVPTSKAPSDPPKAAGNGSGSGGDAAAALAGVVVGGGAGGGAGASDAATGSGLHTIQGPTRLKDSILWDLQQAFYDKEHIKAWSDSMVPNFVTTNAFIAKQYANTILGLMRDLFDPTSAACGQYSPDKPLYIVEVGAGHGKMGFLMVQSLLQMREFFPEHSLEVPFKYIMTDFTDKNVQFWKQHAQFAEMLSTGVLDIAVFNAETDTELKLLMSGEVISAATDSKNPVVVLTNYVFDTITSDALRIENGVLQEALLELQTNEAADVKTPLNPDIIRRMVCKWSYRAVEDPDTTSFYGDDDIDYLVRVYQERMENASLLIPIGGLRMIRNLAKLSQGRLVMLVGDKGYNYEDELVLKRDPHVAVHGSFSMMVNFHALRLFFQRLGGWAVHSPRMDGFKTSVLVLGGPESDFMHTRWAFKDAMVDFGPENFSSLQRSIKDEVKEPSLKLVLALLRCGEWDADLFFKFKHALVDRISHQTVSENTKADMELDVAGVHASYYALLARKDVCFEIGRLLMSIKRHQDAIEFFERSNEYCGHHHVTWHNLGICCYYINHLPAALKCFKASIQLNADYPDARAWHRKVTNHLLRAGQGANDLGSGDDDDSDSSEESPYYSGDAH